MPAEKRKAGDQGGGDNKKQKKQKKQEKTASSSESDPNPPDKIRYEATIWPQKKFEMMRPQNLGETRKQITPKDKLYFSSKAASPVSDDSTSGILRSSVSLSDHRLIFDLAHRIPGCPPLSRPYMKRADALEPAADVSAVVDPDQDEDEETAKPRNWHTQLDTTLPPLSDIDDIFDDIAKNLESTDFKMAISLLKGRPLRFFTMCSGTEAPALAMWKLQEALERTGFTDFSIYHVGSCEIEPFKQAYIQSNFAPPSIYRDVTDFAKKDGTNPLTAYGAAEPSPELVDILVAGSSCVDYSRMNASCSEFQIDGESWATMNGICEYARKCRPLMVILENVKSAPWHEIKGYWETLGYISHVVKVDSKNHYAPQTRERGYMLAIDIARARSVAWDEKTKFPRFENILSSLARRASSPYTDFVYFPDDSMFEKLLIDMMREKLGRKGNTNWSACLLRYIRHRAELKLGFRRPVTHWENNGDSQPPDYFSMRALMRRKCERILDTLDIYRMSYAVEHFFDVYFKNRAVDLSQNVDRERDTKPFGIVPCITPDGQMFDTLRGGMLSGKELLKLQMLPVEELTINTETSKQLTDFAGNAMTTTVVGSVILAALCVAFSEDSKGAKQSLFEDRKYEAVLEDPSLCRLGQTTVLQAWEAQGMICKEQSLDRKEEESVDSLIKGAGQSRQLCLCEGFSGQTQPPFFLCRHCGHTVCATCKGNPEHYYIDLPVKEQRTAPSKFIETIQKNLPRIIGIHEEDIDLIATEMKPSADEGLNTRYQEHIRAAVFTEYCYSAIKRSHTWTIVFISPFGRLELRFFPRAKSYEEKTKLNDDFLLDSMGCEWLLFAVCGESEPAESAMRDLLRDPIAVMIPADDILVGRWGLWDPAQKLVDVKVIGEGTPRPSQESRTGVQALPWKDHQEFQSIRIEFSATFENIETMSWGLLKDCAAPHGSMYRSAKEVDGRYLFFMIDSNPLQPAGEDSYVITRDPRRYNNHQRRSVIARFPAGWRMNIGSDGSLLHDMFECKYVGKWTGGKKLWADLVATYPKQTVYISPIPPASRKNAGDCSGVAGPTFAVDVLLPPRLAASLVNGIVKRLDLARDFGKFRPVEFLLKKLDISAFLSSGNWTSLGLRDVKQGQCECGPVAPGMTWHWCWLNGKCQSKIIKPFEDQAQAGTFEKALKARTSPATALIRCYDGNVMLEVCLNPQTLAHRAVAALGGPDKTGLALMEWRLVHSDPMKPPPIFKAEGLLSNDNDILWPSNQQQDYKPLPQFRRTLWPEQRKLLGWALQREQGRFSGDELWHEVEQSDLLITSMDLSLEARAHLERDVRGGVIADDVGAGKTTSALALIAADLAINKPNTRKRIIVDRKRIVSDATLILVPKDIVDQWNEEAKECFSDASSTVVVLKTVDALIKATLEDLVNARIIIAAWDLFDDVKYWECLRVLSYSPNVPFTGGRAFEEWMNMALDSLGSMLDLYDGDDMAPLWAERENGEKRLQGFTKFPAYRTRDSHKRNYKSNKAPTGPTKEELPASEKYNPDPTEQLDDVTALDKDYKYEMNVWPAAKGDKKTKRLYALFHLFRFRRVIVDEYQYLRDLSLHGVMAQSAEKRWLLSATPPTDTLDGVNVVARLLGTKICNEDVQPEYLGSGTKSSQVVHRRSHVEEFLRCLKAPSTSALEARHQQANKFLRLFFRHNSIKLKGDGISHYIVFKPSALEFATYHEFFQVVLGTSVCFGKKIQPSFQTETRAQCVRRLVEAKPNALHALVRATSDMQPLNWPSDRARVTCSTIFNGQKALFVDIATKLYKGLQETFWFDHRAFPKKMTENEENLSLQNFIRSVTRKGDFEDFTVTDLVNYLLENAANNELEPPELAINIREYALRLTRAANKKKQPIIEKKDWDEATVRKDELSYRCKLLTTLVLNLIKAAKGLRFFDAVSKITKDVERVQCAGCPPGLMKDPKEMILLPTCGHIACQDCLDRQAALPDDSCPSPGCDALVNSRLQIHGSLFTSAAVAPHTKYGTRMANVVAHLQDVLYTKGSKRKSTGANALVFIQFDKDRELLKGALDAAGLQYADACADAGTIVPQFKAGNLGRVLILKIDTSDAAGWNLQMITHVMFATPFLADSLHTYKSIMKQAVGRALRFGQEKDVHVYYFIMARTSEVNILAQREGKAVVLRNGQVLVVDKSQVLDTDESLAGPALGVQEIAGESPDADDGQQGGNGESDE